jgi:cytochrome c biogenesis protein CcdA
MMSTSLVYQSIGVFGTGVLASLSPCVYPILPITLGFLGSRATASNGRRVVVAYAIGQVLALVALGAVAVRLGETLGFSSQSPSVRIGVGVFLLLAGFFSWRGQLPQWMTRWSSRGGQANRSGGLLSAFLLGASGAVLASPCTSPILGGVLALMATAESVRAGIFLMLSYSVGFTLLFLVLGLGVVRAGSLPRSGRWLGLIHGLGTALLFIGGIYYLVSSWLSHRWLF